MLFYLRCLAIGIAFTPVAAIVGVLCVCLILPLTMFVITSKILWISALMLAAPGTILFLPHARLYWDGSKVGDKTKFCVAGAVTGFAIAACAVSYTVLEAATRETHDFALGGLLGYTLVIPCTAAGLFIAMLYHRVVGPTAPRLTS